MCPLCLDIIEDVVAPKEFGHPACRESQKNVIRRYLMKDSVEYMLVKMQERKQLMAEGALGVASDEDKKHSQISELNLLFSTTVGML